MLPRSPFKSGSDIEKSLRDVGGSVRVTSAQDFARPADPKSASSSQDSVNNNNDKHLDSDVAKLNPENIAQNRVRAIEEANKVDVSPRYEDKLPNAKKSIAEMESLSKVGGRTSKSGLSARKSTLPNTGQSDSGGQE